MRKHYILFSAALFLSTMVHAQIAQQQYSFVGKMTATWCNPCGTWGRELQEQIVEDNAGKAVTVELYADGNEQFLFSMTAAYLVSDFTPANSIPTWYVNGVKDDGPTNVAIRAGVQNSVNTNYGLAPLAGAAFTSRIEGNVLKVDAQAQFFKETSGDYYLSVYLVEDSVVAYQNGVGSYAVHNGVLRASASPNAFGNLIASGNISANATYSSSFHTVLNSKWNKSKIWLAAIIWKMTGDAINGYHYDYVNAFSTFQSITTTTGIENFKGSNFQVKSLPNPLSENSSFVISTANTINHATVSLFDVTGRQVSNLFSGNLTAGEHSFMIDPKELENGFYLLRISDGKDQYTKKIIVQK